MRRLCAALLLAAVAPLSAQDPPAVPDRSAAAPETPPVYIPLTAQERWDDFVKRSFSPGALAGRGARVGVTNLWSNNPPEWEGAEGYGKRFASDFSRAWMRRGMESAGAYALGQDPRYIRCPCEGAWKRVAHAMSQAVLTYDDDGNRVFGVARVGSRYAAAMLETTWFPDRYTWKDGFREGSQSFVSVGLFNVMREFWPEIKGKIKRR